MKAAITFVLTALIMESSAFAGPVELRFCINEAASFYFFNKAGTEKTETPGILIDMIRDMEKKLAMPIPIMRRTRRACRTLIEANEVEAYGPVAYELSRDKGWAYPPLKGGVPDPQYAFNTAGYSLFHNADSSFTWNGEKISDLNRYKVGGLEGNSVVDNLKGEGVNVQTFKSLPAMLKRLQNKELDVIAVHANQVERVGAKIGLKRHEKDIYTRAYFLVFSDKFYNANKELAEKIWKFSSGYQSSPEGREAMRKYDSLDDF